MDSAADSERPQAQSGTARDVRMLQAMALGFGVGSVLFAAGTVMAWADVPALVANLAYAVGAVCFTLAAVVQWRAAVIHHPDYERWRARAETDWSNPDWSSAIIQLAGTLMFNAMTLLAVFLPGDPTHRQYEDVWAPDIFGSALFLISSWIAWSPIARARRHRMMPERSRWICRANMIGSVFFAVSAWAASYCARTSSAA